MGYFWSNLEFEGINSKLNGADQDTAASGIFWTASNRDNESRTLATGYSHLE